MNKIILDETRNDMVKLFKGVGVEVGVAEGRFSKTILENPAVKKLYGIDPYEYHKGYRDYVKKATFERMYGNTRKRLDPYGKRFELLQEYSMDAVKRFEDNSLDFVYIDADHSYKTVYEDITEWYKRVKVGGIICGDDYVRGKSPIEYYDVIHAVNDYVEANNIPHLTIYAAGRTPTNWLINK